MMLHELLKSVVWTNPINSTTFLTITGAPGVIAEFHPVAPVRLLKWGFVATTAVVSGAAVTQLNLLLRTGPGVSAGQAAVDTLTTGTTTIAVGNGAYRDAFTASTTTAAIPSEVAAAGPLGVVGNNNVVSGQLQLQLTAGQAWAINVVTSPDTTGAVLAFIEYVLLPISKPSGYGFGATSPDGVVAGSVSLTDNFTRFAS